MSSMRVLVTEDEKRLAAALKRELNAEGFTVDVALDSPDGGDVVEVHVSARPKKIYTPCDRRAIQTIRGICYRLLPNGG